MQPEEITASGNYSGADSERFFTVTSANEALVFVRRVVADIVATYRDLMTLRNQREELGGATETPELVDIRERIQFHVERLNDLHQELIDVGCELKDWSLGLVDFPAIHEGRKVWLCWKLGEDRIEHWHELYAGFSGRRPIQAGFGQITASESGKNGAE